MALVGQVPDGLVMRTGEVGFEMFQISCEALPPMNSALFTIDENRKCLPGLITFGLALFDGVTLVTMFAPSVVPLGLTALGMPGPVVNAWREVSYAAGSVPRGVCGKQPAAPSSDAMAMPQYPTRPRRNDRRP